MVQGVDTYIPAIIENTQNGKTFPTMVVDNLYELSGCYVKWEDYENLRMEFLELACKLEKLEKRS